jgi:UDP-N-acetylglucosamine--N-acetylmuramyl-(pentapeptide) pyrophosphoryl-undecaprenol N-acetylglucosamine transferase
VTTIVFAAGGTGGHLYPAIALAREFMRQVPAVRAIFVGTGRAIESKIVAHEGFELVVIAARPVMGQGLRGAASGVLSLPGAIRQSLALLRKRQAALVLGVGGYASLPVLVAGRLLGLPRAVLEPNAYPGVANRVVGPMVDRVFLAFHEASRYFPAAKVWVTGMPVRRELLMPAGSLPEDPTPEMGPMTLLVLGGSQGARAINEAMLAALPRWEAMGGRLTIVHQTGEADHARVKAAYDRAGVRAHVAPFLFDLPQVMRTADLVVSRAGAMTVAELTVCGKPAILIPLPRAIHQHQTHNARVLAQAGGAVLLPEEELSGERLAQEVASLLHDRTRLWAMAERSRRLGQPNAAESIVRHCLALIRRAG